MKRMLTMLTILCLVIASLAQARGDDKKGRPPVQLKKTGAFDPTGFSHKIGALWTQVTNYGFYGDRAYSEPNFEWPGGSGNLYGWLQSIWIGAVVDSLGYVSLRSIPSTSNTLPRDRSLPRTLTRGIRI
jgi:hypothetical protein